MSELSDRVKLMSGSGALAKTVAGLEQQLAEAEAVEQIMADSVSDRTNQLAAAQARLDDALKGWAQAEAARTRLAKESCRVFNVTDGTRFGRCYSFFDHFDIHWDDGSRALSVADLSYIGVKKAATDEGGVMAVIEEDGSVSRTDKDRIRELERELAEARELDAQTTKLAKKLEADRDRLAASLAEARTEAGKAVDRLAEVCQQIMDAIESSSTADWSPHPDVDQCNWNPDAHVYVTLTVADCRAIKSVLPEWKEDEGGE